MIAVLRSFFGVCLRRLTIDSALDVRSRSLVALRPSALFFALFRAVGGKIQINVLSGQTARLFERGCPHDPCKRTCRLSDSAVEHMNFSTLRLLPDFDITVVENMAAMLAEEGYILH